MRHGQPVERPAGTSPPCHQCPKQSPQEAHKYELSLKNIRTLAMYFQQRATSGVCLSEAERSDAIVRQNIGIIEQAFWTHSEAKRDEVAALLPAAIARASR